MEQSYEYDAPQFYDFKREDDGTSMASKWFDARHDALRSPLDELPQGSQATSKAQPSKPAADAAAPSKASGVVRLISNIVTSWGSLAAVKTHAGHPSRPGQTSARAPAKQHAAAVHSSRPGAGACSGQENKAPPACPAAGRSKGNNGKATCGSAVELTSAPRGDEQGEAKAAGKQAAAKAQQPSAVKEARGASQQQAVEAPAGVSHVADELQQRSNVKRPRRAWQLQAADAEEAPAALLELADEPEQQNTINMAQTTWQQAVAGASAEDSQVVDEPQQHGSAKQPRRAWPQQVAEQPASVSFAAEQPEQQTSMKKVRKTWQQQAVEAPAEGPHQRGSLGVEASQRRLSGQLAGRARLLHAAGRGRQTSGLHLAPALCKRTANRRLSQARLAVAAAQQGGVGAAAAASACRGAAAAKLKKALQPHKLLPARSSKPVTLPDAVELHTSKLARTQRDADLQGSPFKALALKVEDFQQKRTVSRSKPPSLPGRPLSITEPKAPLLHTSARTRPSQVKSSEQRAQEELAAMPKFHALKLNTSALQGSGQLKLARPADAPGATAAQPFVFVTEDRAVRRRKREAAEQEQEQAPAFKAQPLDRSILEGPVRAPARRRRFSCTVPKSPQLHTKLRSKEAPPKALQDLPKQEPKARDLPGPRAFWPPEPLPAPTQPRPFKLRTESRGRHYTQELEVRREREEAAARAARIPRAQLLPLSLDVPMVPPRPEPRVLTVPKPFNLRSEARHQDCQEQLSRERQEEEAARASVRFKARPLPSLSQVFQVHESQAALTVPQEPRFLTGSRAAGRAQFDQAMQEKAWLTEEHRRQEAAARQAEEEQAVRELRRGLVVAARAVPDFSRPFMAMPSGRLLTDPVTPKLGRRRAKRTRKQALE